MVKMIIFEPAMCCSTGVCGPAIDPELLRISTVLNNFEKNGIKVERYNLSNNPQAFVENETITEILNKDGIDALPVTMVDGKVVKTKKYPTNEELLDFLNVAKSYLEVREPHRSFGCGCGGRRC